MKSITENYRNQVEAIIRGMDLLVKYEFVPFSLDNKHISQATINELKENLKEERFIISICGQIKSGKSTLLNYILFNSDDILPTDVVTWTAKITKIYYGEETHFLVHYYSEAKWAELKSLKLETETPPITYNEKYLNKELKKRADLGIRETDKIKNVALTEKDHNLKELSEYIAKDGKYTPFVDYVEIISNNEFIKDVILVDTPGLNDSNVHRSNLTKEFIDKSSAVIYLLHSNAPLSKTDVEFIKKYLYHIPTEKLLFAISHSDIIEGDVAHVVDYVTNSLNNQPEIKHLNLLKNRKVHAISTIAAIISEKTKSNRSLSEFDELCKHRIHDSFLKNEGNLPELIKAIEENIMTNKGESIISASRETVRGYCIGKINVIMLERARLVEKFDALNKTKAEIEKQISKIQHVQRGIDHYKNKREKVKNAILNKHFLLLHEKLKTIKKTIKIKYKEKLESLTSFQEAKDYSQYYVKEIIEDDLTKFFIEGLDTGLKKTLEDFQKETQANLQDLTKSVLPRWDPLFEPVINFQNWRREIKNHFTELNSDYLEKFRKHKFWVVTDDKRANGDIELMVYNSIDSFFDDRLESGLNAEIHAVIHGRPVFQHRLYAKYFRKGSRFTK